MADNCNRSNISTSDAVILNNLYVSLTAVSSVLSMCGSILLILIIIKFELRTNARMLLVYLSVCDFVMAAFNIIGIIWYSKREDLPALCKAQSAGGIASAIASFLWTFIIGLNAFLTVIFKNKVLTRKLTIHCHLLAWGVPLVTVIAAAAADVLGYDKCIEVMTMCWINPDKLSRDPPRVLAWQLVTGKFWEWSTLLSLSIMFAAIAVSIKNHVRRIAQIARRSNVNKDFASANRKLVFVPLVFIIARFWGTLRFLLGFTENATLAGYLAPIQGLGDSSQGFLNCAIFITTTPQITSKLHHQFMACLRRLFGQSNQGPSKTSQHQGNAIPLSRSTEETTAD